mmetsp:Transcript_1091/g.2176  ORF Transcript_1091/g.2176 Transcript_1091/m.2176 type:complete len:256 (-) Transcript_1091:960-1727(-)
MHCRKRGVQAHPSPLSEQRERNYASASFPRLHTTVYLHQGEDTVPLSKCVSFPALLFLVPDTYDRNGMACSSERKSSLSPSSPRQLSQQFSGKASQYRRGILNGPSRSAFLGFVCFQVLQVFLQSHLVQILGTLQVLLYQLPSSFFGLTRIPPIGARFAGYSAHLWAENLGVRLHHRIHFVEEENAPYPWNYHSTRMAPVGSYSSVLAVIHYPQPPVRSLCQTQLKAQNLRFCEGMKRLRQTKANHLGSSQKENG